MEIKEVFEPVLNFIRNLQKKDKELTSKQAAKDRLKLVLMQDRASVSPDFFEMMKQEIIDVIKKYIEIDEEALEVELTRGLDVGLEGPALYANIPIKNVKPVAPKVSNDEEIDELIIGEVDDELTGDTSDSFATNVEEQTIQSSKTSLSEAEAEVVAEKILAKIEQSVKEDMLTDDTIVDNKETKDGDVFDVPVTEAVAREISEIRAEIEVAERERAMGNGIVNKTKKKVVKSVAVKKKTTGVSKDIHNTKMPETSRRPKKKQI